MICLRCLAQSPAAKLPLRPLRNLRVQRNSITSCKTSSSRSFTHATARSNAAQPFVTPAAASPTARDAAADSISAVGGKKKDKAQVTVQSSVPAGTILKGLNFHKDKQDPIAMEDSEYPDWLWNVLKEVRTAGGAKEQKAEAAKGKKGHKKGLKPERETIPVHRQTIDLPTGDGTDAGTVRALQATSEVTRAMRAERRAKIKEDNFLRTMK